MLRIVEYNRLGEGQQIEEKMADNVGDIDVRIIHVDEEVQKRADNGTSSGPLAARKAHVALAEHMQDLLQRAGFQLNIDA
jgi:hypothetical protein